MNTTKKLSLKTQIFYGFGVSYAIVDQIFVQWLIYYYLPPESTGLKPLIAPIFITITLIISRIVDMISDPLIGYLSDNFKSPYGRRIPFIAFGAIPLAFSTIGLFFPIFLKSNSVYLIMMGSIFFIFYSIVGAPYNALIPDISNNKIDILNLSTWQSLFRLIYTAIAMITPGFLISFFGQNDIELGIRKMVISLSLFSLIGMYITVFGVKEPIVKKNSSKNNSFSKSVKLIFQDKSFIYYLLGLVFFFAGFNTLRTCINYYIENIMLLNKYYLTIISGILFGASAIFFYPINLLSRKFGYRKIMLISLILLILLSSILYNLGKSIPIYFGFIIFPLIGIAISGSAFIFPPAMLSEIINKSKNKSIEGLYFGIQGFFLKLAFLISVGIVPILLVTGKNQSLKDSLFNSTNTVTNIGIYNTTLFSIIMFILSFIFYYIYKE